MTSPRSAREQILDAAEALLAQHGVAGTTMAAVRDASGFLPGSIYHHVGSKERLVGAVMERAADRFLADDPPWAELPGEPGERLRTLLTLSAERFNRHPTFLRLFLLLGLADEPSTREHVERVRALARDHFTSYLTAAYAPLGDHRAAAVAARLTPFALAVFDGAFVAAEIDRLDVTPVFDTLHDALTALARP